MRLWEDVASANRSERALLPRRDRRRRRGRQQGPNPLPLGHRTDRPHRPGSRTRLHARRQGAHERDSPTRRSAYWNPVDGKLVRALAGHADVVTSVVVTADGTKIVAAGGDKTIRTWNVADGKPPEPRRSRQPLRSAVSRPRPIRHACCRLRRRRPRASLDLTTGKELQRFTGHKGAITSLHVAADGKRIFSASADKSVARRWTVAANA